MRSRSSSSEGPPVPSTPMSAKAGIAASPMSSKRARVITVEGCTGPPMNSGSSPSTSVSSSGTASPTVVSEGRLSTSPNAPSWVCSTISTTVRKKFGSISRGPAISSCPLSDSMGCGHPPGGGAPSRSSSPSTVPSGVAGFGVGPHVPGVGRRGWARPGAGPSDGPVPGAGPSNGPVPEVGPARGIGHGSGPPGGNGHGAGPPDGVLICTPATYPHSPPLQPVGAADHIEHDLVGSRSDAVEAQIPPHALDSVLLHVPVAAVDLDALVGHLDGDPGGVQLGHRDLPHRIFAVLKAPGGGVDHLTGALDLGRHLSELVPDDLEAADRASEGGALLGVAQGPIEHVLGGGHRAGGADQALALQLPHDVVEALADLAQQAPPDGVKAPCQPRPARRGRDPQGLGGEECGVGSVHAQLLKALLADH